MKKIRAALVAVLLLPSPAPGQGFKPVAPEAPVPPEVTTAVELSNRDVNRISCPGVLKDVTTSEEKGVRIKIVGGDAFVKFLVRKKGEEETYATAPTEFFAVCNDSVYQLIGFPRGIPSRTIRLRGGVEDAVQANLERFRGLALEQKVRKLVQEAYLGDYPETYLVRRAAVEVTVYADLRITLREVVDVQGEGLRLKKYELTGGAVGLELEERQFVSSAFGENLLFVALEDLRLAPGATTRLYVVESRRELL